MLKERLITGRPIDSLKDGSSPGERGEEISRKESMVVFGDMLLIGFLNAGGGKGEWKRVNIDKRFLQEPSTENRRTGTKKS